MPKWSLPFVVFCYIPSFILFYFLKRKERGGGRS
jgi:hypothetical protein